MKRVRSQASVARASSLASSGLLLLVRMRLRLDETGVSCSSQGV